MSLFSGVTYYLSRGLEKIGLYEPEINVDEARGRLESERKVWLSVQGDRSDSWNQFQFNNEIDGELSPLVNRAITHLEENEISQGVAVDLGCGISNTAFNLLERGWKVYAVDGSQPVLDTLVEKVSSLGKTWIEDGQLVLVNQSIENFEFPEQVHLVTATESLPYCDPGAVNDVFLKIKEALAPKGVFTGNLFPYENPLVDGMLRGMFGAWMTTKNVVDAIMESVDFGSYSVTNGKSASGVANQFHIFAQKEDL